MEDLSKWTVEYSSKASVSLSSVSGYSNSGIKMDYDLGTSSVSWVQMRRDFYLDLSRGNAFKFFYKGDGDENYLEFKITDYNGDVFGIQNFNLTSLPDWQEVLLSLDTTRQYPIKYLWNDSTFGTGDKILDSDKIRKVEFTISKKDGGEGSVYIDDFSLVFSSRVILNDFNVVSSSNLLNGSWGIMPSTSLISTEFTEDSYEGKYALKVVYNSTSSWSGIWNFLSSSTTGYYDLSFTDRLSFYLKGKGRMKIELKYYSNSGSSLQTKYVYLNYDSIYYKNYEVLLSSFSGLNKSKVNQLNFVWENSSGTVYIDRIEFNSGNSDNLVENLEEFEDALSVTPWSIYSDKSNVATTLETEGRTGDAIKINYEFVDGNWVAYVRNWGCNFYDYDGISFYLKGEGEQNNLEVKIEDFDGTTFIRKFFSATSLAEFKKFFIPFDEFSLFSYTDNDEIDLKNIVTLWFTVSAKNSGSGSIILDEVIIEKEKVLSSDGGIFKDFSVTNPVFSPDGDGYNDSIEFNFRIENDTKIEFEIYNLRGKRIEKIKRHYNAGNVSFKYEPGDIKNGIYFWYLKGENLSGKEIKRNVFAVQK